MHPLVWEVHLQKDRRTTCVFWFLLALLGFWHPAHCKITFLLFFHSLYFLSWDSMNVSGLKTNSIHFQPEKFLLLDLKYVDCLELHLVSSFGIIRMGYAIHHCFSCSVLVPFMSFLQEVRIELKDIIFPEKRKSVPKIRALEKSCCNCLASAVFPGP